MLFGYNTEIAKKVGIRTDIIRGEDGSLALGLKKYGKISFLRNRKARAVTCYRTLSADGSPWRSLRIRLWKQIINITSYLFPKTAYIDDPGNLVNKK